MLSFELSAIDIVLVIVTLVILLLYLKKPSPAKTRSESDAGNEKEIDAQIPNIFEIKKTKTNSQLNSLECLHYSEYLKKISNGSSIPDECYVCPRMMQCAAIVKARVGRNK